MNRREVASNCELTRCTPMDKKAQALAVHERLIEEAKACANERADKAVVMIERAKQVPVASRSAMLRFFKRRES